jgi:hypothetical protein
MSEERQVEQVLARYVRAADARDGAAMAALFEADGSVEIVHNDSGELRPVAELQGAEAIGQAVAGMLKPHPLHGWSHHTTSNHMVEVDGDTATIDAQFVVFETVGAERPAAGWPAGASGLQGTVTPIESGYYRPTLRRVDDLWRLQRMRIFLDMPIAVPGA